MAGIRMSVLDTPIAGEIHPTLNKELALADITASSAKKLWWLGKCGHTWEASVGNRVNGSGCPFCSGNRVLEGFNDLGTTHPEIASTWSSKNLPLTSSEVSAKSHKTVWWELPCGHVFEMVISQKTRSGNSCKVCSGHVRSVGENDLATTHSALIAEWDASKNLPIKPQDVQAGSSANVWWIGKCGHSYQSRVSSRTRKKPSGCPVCRNQKVISGVNDLATTHPRIEMEFSERNPFGLSPKSIVAGSESKVWWRCSQGHEYQTTPALRTSRGTGCPVCANLVIVPGHNDLLSKFPEIAAEWDFAKNAVSPASVGSGSKKLAWFTCSRGHSYRTQIHSRTHGSGCPFCGRKRILQGFNDLATEFPTIASLWDYEKNDIAPQDVISGSPKKFWFKCNLGHSYITSVFNKTNERTGCPVCSNHELLVGFNDLAFSFPEIASQWHPTRNGEHKPSGYVWGSHSRAWFLCDQGHEWQTAIVGRQKSGCPSCAKYGFDQTKPSILYVLSHRILGATKVGITNVGTTRLQTFKFSGWTVEKEFLFEDGLRALAIEKAIKFWWRKELVLPVFLARSDIGRAGGETETVAASLMPANDVIARIEFELSKSR